MLLVTFWSDYENEIDFEYDFRISNINYSQTSTNGHLPTTATSLQRPYFPVPTSEPSTQILVLKTFP